MPTIVSCSPEDLKLSSYGYHLPPQSVAQRPASPRSSSRLLVYDVQKAQRAPGGTFLDLPELLPPQSTLVVNDSQVLPARILSPRAQLLVLTPRGGPQQVECLIKAPRALKRPGAVIPLPGGGVGRVLGRSERGFFVSLEGVEDLPQYLMAYGQLPLPPYVRSGLADEQDLQSYQTLFARGPGSLAAPTAGLHFDQALVEKLKAMGHKILTLTLHVGAGTFLPVRCEHIADHPLPSEEFSMEDKVFETIQEATNLYAVGTTVLRAIEMGTPRGRSDLFFYPGGRAVRRVDGLITNFHLPHSTLLMLVASLVGRKTILQLYQRAQEEGFRFYSYGDGMLMKNLR